MGACGRRPAGGRRFLAKERLIAITAIALVAVIGRDWDGVVFLIAIDVVIFLGLVAEHVRIESPTPATA